MILFYDLINELIILLFIYRHVSTPQNFLFEADLCTAYTFKCAVL